jgi:hypothetical protein
MPGHNNHSAIIRRLEPPTVITSAIVSNFQWDRGLIGPALEKFTLIAK